MAEIDELQTYAVNILQDVIARADAAEDGAMRAEAFAELMFEHLAEAGEIDDGISCPFEGRGIRCSGYFLSEDNDRLDLFLVLPRLEGAATTIPKADVDVGFKRLGAYLERSLGGLHKEREEALPGYDMTRAIWEARRDLSHVRLFVITDGLATIDQIGSYMIGPIEVSSHLWDLRRLHRAVSSGSNREPIHVDFSKLGGAVRCIVVSPPGGGYRCLMAVLPGSLLVEMYRQHGPRLLERNVRSFLQLRGKVNQNIRKTIIDEPQMFLAFNNGLSITATGLKVIDHGDGTADLIEANDFQIVNGGQTTGSIYRAWRKDQADISLLQVPLKITEILSEGDVEKIASRISQSANNQNKVDMADFSSNQPFHRAMQELSRSIWAPPASGMQRQSRWFYERARGQYHDALADQGSDSERRKWELIHPRSQLITKTDLAKYEQTWSQKPHIVSRHGQKNYLDFMFGLDQRGVFQPDERYFQRCMARAILFRQTETIVSRQKFGGYRAQIVTYLLAWLSHHTAKRVDFDAIWLAQDLPEELASFIETLSVYAHSHVTTPPGGQDIGEWCKKEACWEGFRARIIEIPSAVEARLLSRESTHSIASPSVLEEHLSDSEREQVARIAEIPAQTWYDIAAWAKDTQSLQPWQRSIAFSLGKQASNHKPPSRKQAVQGERILTEARAFGFQG